MMVRNIKTGQIGKVHFKNLNPMAGIPGYHVVFKDGRTAFWTLGECEEVEDSIVSDTRRTERAVPPATNTLETPDAPTENKGRHYGQAKKDS